MLGAFSTPNTPRPFLHVESTKSTNTWPYSFFYVASYTFLEELSYLYYHCSEMCVYVREVGGHQQLRKLGLYFYEAFEEYLQSMVTTLPVVFPRLVTLELHFFDTVQDLSRSRFMTALTGIAVYPTLALLKCGLCLRDDLILAMFLHGLSYSKL